MNSATSDHCALLTPPGSGAIAVIQISGPRANEILRACFTSSRADVLESKSNTLIYGKIADCDEVIDDVIIGTNVTDNGPGFYVYTHGGVRVVERVIEVLDKLGARLIDKPSPRDLWQADNEVESEVFEHLANARTERAVRFLCHQRRHLALTISQIATLAEQSISNAKIELQKLVRSIDAVNRLIQGVTVVLVGKPNAGKSTLFNRLVGREAAVVTPIPGTTRDWVSESIEIRGIPIKLIDTAGLRETADHLEHQAMAAGQDLLEHADLCIEVRDAADNSQSLDAIRLETGSLGPKRLIAWNKIDLCDAPKPPSALVDSEHHLSIQISARNGHGIEELASAIESHLGFSDLTESQSHLFTGRQVKLARMILSDLEISNDRFTQFLREIIGERSIYPKFVGI